MDDNININDLKRFIERNYNLKVTSITPASRGMVAITYKIVTKKSQIYFVKVVKVSEYSEIIKYSLPVLYEMNEKGIANINYPIINKNNDYLCDYKSFYLFLLNFIEGKWTLSFDLEQYSRLIAIVHKKTTEIKSQIFMENFDISFAEEFLLNIRYLMTNESNELAVNELKNLISPIYEEIMNDWNDFKIVRQECRLTPFKMKITHGDAPGNIMVDHNKNVFLIDWDEIVLAPAERDTWFHKYNEKFLDLYREYFPGYEVNELSYKFYLYSRYFSEMANFLANVLSINTIEAKKHNILGFKKSCLDWLRPLILKTR